MVFTTVTLGATRRSIPSQVIVRSRLRWQRRLTPTGSLERHSPSECNQNGPVSEVPAVGRFDSRSQVTFIQGNLGFSGKSP